MINFIGETSHPNISNIEWKMDVFKINDDDVVEWLT